MNTAPPIGSRSRLVQQLHVATELEHSLCCQYLYAVFSLRRTSADYPEHLDRERVELMMNATGRWATDIFALAREEMEHLAIATNMLSAINEPPHLTHHDYPDQGLEPFLGAPLVLERCNLDTLRRFQFFERPKGLEGAKTPAVEAIYLEIKSLFQTLRPASELFTGDGLRQLDPTDFELGVSMKVLSAIRPAPERRSRRATASRRGPRSDPTLMPWTISRLWPSVWPRMHPIVLSRTP
jgi:hypothetical protein